MSSACRARRRCGSGAKASYGRTSTTALDGCRSCCGAAKQPVVTVKQSARHGFPALCLARVRLCRVLLGQRASLHSLRQRSPIFVRLLHKYYRVVRLLAGVRVGRAAIAFSHRSVGLATDAEQGLPVLVRGGSGRAWGLPTAPGPAQTRDGVCVGVAFRIRALRRRPKRVLSRLHTQPARAPVNASPTASRPPTHDSGSGWFAIPFLCGSCIRSFPPVYPGARSVPEPPRSPPVSPRENGPECDTITGAAQQRDRSASEAVESGSMTSITECVLDYARPRLASVCVLLLAALPTPGG